MDYATQGDMVNRFGSDEIVVLTDRARLGLIDAGVLAAAITTASQEIDTYLSRRYPLPLSSVPGILTGICCDIARYRLVGTSVNETEAIRDRYKDAVRLLERISNGTANLGLPIEQEPATSERIRAVGSARVFTADTLRDY
ncbi:DUF1320 domain-containing protein [Leeia sp. TBRC 13508]|uniref:DUF1320 domain-containing protein n=1 Tax=Leeia speluncae TaxID=2884804 RepID=A0ABS8D2A3_9NEIS|nr:DUF1320 domain-containing protein [Leeia speluncae]MCB6182316.1 DUF1320 domain-containing protein [Leeia speluncae]